MTTNLTSNVIAIARQYLDNVNSLSPNADGFKRLQLRVDDGRIELSINMADPRRVGVAYYPARKRNPAQFGFILHVSTPQVTKCSGAYLGNGNTKIYA